MTTRIELFGSLGGIVGDVLLHNMGRGVALRGVINGRDVVLRSWTRGAARAKAIELTIIRRMSILDKPLHLTLEVR